MTTPADPLESRDGQRPPWSLFRAALEEAGFRPSKTRGQNFLVDPNAARSIAADAGLPAGARVLEVGAGCGFLTLHLAELGFDLVAVEIEPRLLEVARRCLAGHGRVHWICADALAGKHALAPEVAAAVAVPGPWHLVSNLPYSISAPLLVVLARLAHPPESMTVLVQEEVARRLTARPGTPEWGPLSVRLGLLYRAHPGRAVGAQLFWPRPRVASRVVHLRLEPLPGLTPALLAACDGLVEGLFRERRKQLLGALGERVGGRERAVAVLAELGIDPRARAEILEPGQWLALARATGVWTGEPRSSRG